MYPVLIDWGPIFLPSWHVFFVLAAVAAYFAMMGFASKLDGRDAVSQRVISDLFLVGYVSGYFGARTFSIFVDQSEVVGFFPRIHQLFVLGPMTFYGGAIGCFIACSLYVIYQRLKFSPLFDVCLPACVLALAIGRVGCFLNGDDYGIAVGAIGTTGPWWAVVFPYHHEIVPRFPIQLLETVVAGAIFLFSWVRFDWIREKYGSGSVGIFVCLSYSFYRFWGEFLRGDPRGWVIDGWLSPSQLVSLLVFLLAMVALVAKHREETPRQSS